MGQQCGRMCPCDCSGGNKEIEEPHALNGSTSAAARNNQISGTNPTVARQGQMPAHAGTNLTQSDNGNPALTSADLASIRSAHKAAEDGDIKALTPLLPHYVDGLNAQDQVPLHSASRTGKIEAVRLLLKHKADANATDKNMKTPLHCAVSQRHVDVVTALINAKAKIDQKDDYWSTPLFDACNDQNPCLESLLRLKADVNTQNKGRATPLIEAIHNAASESVSQLVKAKADVNTQDKLKCMALHHAVKSTAKEESKLAITKTLLEAKADLAAKNQDNLTPLEIAQQRKLSEALIKLLVP